MHRPDECPIGGEPCQSLCDTPCTTSLEIADWRADAARYRWLRGGSDVPQGSQRWPRWEVRSWDGRFWQTLFAEKMDTAVDAAMKRDAMPNVELTGTAAALSPQGPATEGSEVERRVGGAVSPAPTFEKKGYGNENAA